MSRFSFPQKAASALLLASVSCFAQTLDGARAALMQGRVEDAEQRLNSELARTPGSAEASLLLCRVFYAQNRFDEAQEPCQAAADTAPRSSEAQLWLGRVLGQRASTANPLVAFTLARKVHAAFERAVQLDPNNAAAMSDLGEFLVAAPALVGGGLDKARELAPRLVARDLVRGHRLMAMIAHKDGNLAGEEREVEAEASSGSPAGLADVAMFRAHNQQADLAVAAARRAIEADHAHDEALVDAAAILIYLQREPQLARQALTDYLHSSAKSDAAPAFKVQLQLARLLRSLGDSAGADRETALANGLAPGYVSRQKSAGLGTIR